MPCKSPRIIIGLPTFQSVIMFISVSDIHFFIKSGFINASHTTEAGALICVVLLRILSFVGEAGIFIFSFLRPGYPPSGFSCLLSQEHAQLCAVLLHMPQVVELELRKRQLSPGERAQPVRLVD